MDARRAGFHGLHGVCGGAAHGLVDGLGLGVQHRAEGGGGDLVLELAVELEALVRGEVDDLGGVQRLSQLGGQQVGVDAQRPAIAVEADGIHDGYDLRLNQLGEEFLVDAIDAAGELVVHALDDAERRGADGVRQCGLQAVLRQALDHEMGDAGGGADGEVEGGGVGHARALVVGDRDFAGLRKLFDLVPDAVDHDDLDAQAAEHGEVDQDVGEVFVGDDDAVERDDKGLALKPGDVFQDAAQVGRFDVGAIAHRRSDLIRHRGALVNGLLRLTAP